MNVHQTIVMVMVVPPLLAQVNPVPVPAYLKKLPPAYARFQDAVNAGDLNGVVELANEVEDWGGLNWQILEPYMLTILDREIAKGNANAMAKKARYLDGKSMHDEGRVLLDKAVELGDSEAILLKIKIGKYTLTNKIEFLEKMKPLYINAIKSMEYRIKSGDTRAIRLLLENIHYKKGKEWFVESPQASKDLIVLAAKSGDPYFNRWVALDKISSNDLKVRLQGIAEMESLANLNYLPAAIWLCRVYNGAEYWQGPYSTNMRDDAKFEYWAERIRKMCNGVTPRSLAEIYESREGD